MTYKWIQHVTVKVDFRTGHLANLYERSHGFPLKHRAPPEIRGIHHKLVCISCSSSQKRILLFLLIVYSFTTSEQNLTLLFANNYSLEFKRNTVLQQKNLYLSSFLKHRKKKKTTEQRTKEEYDALMFILSIRVIMVNNAIT